ncbi:MAG: hypothetical protein ACK2UV_09335, partial [Candidatus Promineifilaceae bacterium]
MLLLLSFLSACTADAAPAAPQPTAAAVATVQPTPTAEPQPTARPTATPIPSPSPSPAALGQPPDLRYLQAAIEETLGGFDGFSSYVVIDLASGERIARNENVAIAGMSLIKVPILINTYRTLDLPLTSEENKLIGETTAQS